MEEINLAREILVNLVAELIAILIFAALGLAIWLNSYIRNRRSLLSFFGVGKGNNIHIILSNLSVVPGGTDGLEQTKEGYSGPAISKLEYDGALLLQEQLKSRTIAILPKSIRDYLDQNVVELKTIDVPIKISPLPLIDEEIFHNNLIVVGTGVYNSISRFLLKDFLPQNRERYFFYGTKTKKRIRVIGFQRKGSREIYRGREERTELAFIQRINADVSGTGKEISVFICVGLGSSATYGSLRYLSENWRSIHRKCSNREFGIKLAFPNQAPDGEFVQTPEEEDIFLED